MTRGNLVHELLLGGCAAALVIGGVAGCSGPSAATGAPSRSAPSSSASSAPSAPPDATPDPSTPSGNEPDPTTRPPKDGLHSRSPDDSPPASHPPAGGTGPAGSVAVTGTSGVALTFDDGPDVVNTPKILDVLKQNQVKATFCLVGFRVRDNPELVRRIVAEGHTLCNHSWQHLLDLGKRTPDYIRWDLAETNKAIQAAAPGARIRYFRAPGGNFTPSLVQLARQAGMTPLYWKVDPRDWDNAKFGTGQPMVNHVVAAVQNAASSGAIVLSHDNKHPETITAYATLLPWLKARFTLIALPA